MSVAWHSTDKGSLGEGVGGIEENPKRPHSDNTSTVQNDGESELVALTRVLRDSGIHRKNVNQISSIEFGK